MSNRRSVFVSHPNPDEIVRKLGGNSQLKYDIYTFWSLEQAFPRGQLRYHAGQVAMLHLLKRLSGKGFSVHALICDSQARSLLAGHHTSTEPNVIATYEFITTVSDASIKVGRMSDYIKQMPPKGSPNFGIDPDLVVQGALRFRNALQAVGPVGEVLKELEAYRIFSENPSVSSPVRFYLQKLQGELQCSSVTDGELLAALYASLRRPKWFDAFWLGEMAAWLAGEKTSSGREIVILEANRSAYSWLTHECFLKLGISNLSLAPSVRWPAMCFVEPLLGLNGKGPMELSKPKNALFIASSPTKIRSLLERTPAEVKTSFSQWFAVDPSDTGDQVVKLSTIEKALLSARSKVEEKGPGLSKDNAVFVEPERVRSEEQPPSIALSLSGGGFRATFFHLGTISLLRQCSLLSNVQAIYSVSGGSILAANLALNWEKYLSGDAGDFKIASAPLFAITKENPRGKLLWGTLFGLLSYRGPRLLSSIYAEKANIQGELQNLPVTPAFNILATSIKSGNLVSFSRDGFKCEGKSLGGAHLPLSQAVAASSAFPPLLAPVVLTAKQLMVTEKELGSDLERLTDGGIYDNLGLVSMLDEIHSGKDEHGCDTVLSSDASAPFSESRSERYLFLFGRAARTTDILMKRVADLESKRAAMYASTHVGHLSPHLIRINIESKVLQSAIKSRVGCLKYQVQDEVVQGHVARVRTDLNRFSEVEMAALIRHGYETALLQLASNGLLPKGFTPEDPCLALSLPPITDVSKIRKSLSEASVRRYRGSYIFCSMIAIGFCVLFKWGGAACEFAIVRGAHLKDAINQYFSL